MHITLPSRLVGDVRKIRGTEITVIAEQSDGAGAGDGGFSTLLGGCWLQTVDRGPYPDAAFSGDPEKPAWARVLKGDLLTGIIFLRQFSLTDGDVYAFDVQCEGDGCKKNIPWELKLSQLPLKWLPEASAERLKAGQPFETSVAGKKVLFDLQTLAQEEPVLRLMKQQKRAKGTIVDVLAGQIRSVEGVGPDIRARWRWLSELSMGELFDLRAAMEEHDCGIETELEVVCQNRACQLEQTVNLPLARRFFSPRKKRRGEPEEAWAEETPPPAASGAGSSEARPASGGGASTPTSPGSSTAGAGTAD